MRSANAAYVAFAMSYICIYIHTPVLYLSHPSRAGIIRRVFEMFEIIKNAVDRGTCLDSGFISRHPRSTFEISRVIRAAEIRATRFAFFNVYRNKLASHANPGFCCQFINTREFQIYFGKRWIS